MDLADIGAEDLDADSVTGRNLLAHGSDLLQTGCKDGRDDGSRLDCVSEPDPIDLRAKLSFVGGKADAE